MKKSWKSHIGNRQVVLPLLLSHSLKMRLPKTSECQSTANDQRSMADPKQTGSGGNRSSCNTESTPAQEPTADLHPLPVLGPSRPHLGHPPDPI